MNRASFLNAEEKFTKEDKLLSGPANATLVYKSIRGCATFCLLIIIIVEKTKKEERLQGQALLMHWYFKRAKSIFLYLKEESSSSWRQDWLTYKAAQQRAVASNLKMYILSFLERFCGLLEVYISISEIYYH